MAVLSLDENLVLSLDENLEKKNEKNFSWMFSWIDKENVRGSTKKVFRRELSMQHYSTTATTSA